MEINTLNQIRKIKNITFDELTKISGIPKSTITNILLGRTKHPRIDTLRAIEKALGIEQAQNNKSIELNEEETKLITLYRELPKTLKRGVIEFIKQTAQAVKENRA